ncbi:TRAP transporter small permease subunit [Geminisphaera colitermitum]|uniref:TRAP transporter small permease subunit n=1 Tax=Geminisphaera colitermitum TaxID=1148786 RepID=UPI000158D0A0|nr:TRAP transporter small permease subunit [Geminisphaera colitermitum]
MTDSETTTNGLSAASATTAEDMIPSFLQTLRDKFANPVSLPDLLADGRLTALLLRWLRSYVKTINKINYAVGHVAMYLLVALLGILVWSIVAKGIQSPSLWVMEMAQFTMAAYYLLGAGFSMQQGAHVRMDFLYEKWSPRRRSLVDSITSVFMIFYLVMLVIGGWGSSADAIIYEQRNRSVWAPYMAPIKIIMTTGMFLMLLQATAELIKDICRACKIELLPETPASSQQEEDAASA